eukprot:9267553-Lingulodinium_polyedra.AAC.1
MGGGEEPLQGGAGEAPPTPQLDQQMPGPEDGIGEAAVAAHGQEEAAQAVEVLRSLGAGAALAQEHQEEGYQE